MEMKVGGDNDRGQDVVDGPRSRQNRNNVFVTKKNVAEGMMDISLLTANANQLKFILYYSQESKMFYPTLVLIILSLILQVAVGILLIFRVSWNFVLCARRAIQWSDIILIVIMLTSHDAHWTHILLKNSTPLLKMKLIFLETLQIRWSTKSSEYNEWEFGASDISDNSNKHIGCGF